MIKCFSDLKQNQGFSHGSEVKNLPANAGDSRSVSGLRKIPHVMRQLSLCATATSLCPRAGGPYVTRGATAMRSLHTAARLHSPQLEKNLHSNEDPAQPKLKTIQLFKNQSW